MSDKKKQIIERIQKMSGEYSVYQLFDDWISMFALATAQAVDYKESREKAYLQIAGKHTKERMEQFCELNGILIDAFENEMSDILGFIYMHLELGSSRTGQFFTPYHLCQLMAKMAYKSAGEKDIYTCNEPSCGGGGNIIAFAEELKNQGINYQTRMEAVCQDIDIRAVYMTYVQCSYLGIPAVVYQSDTLRDPTGADSSTGRLYTPQYILNGSRKIEPQESEETMSKHWIDDADHWICPDCGFITGSPSKYEGCKCPKCGFQDEKDKVESEDKE